MVTGTITEVMVKYHCCRILDAFSIDVELKMMHWDDLWLLLCSLGPSFQAVLSQQLVYPMPGEESQNPSKLIPLICLNT